jgi:dihydrofolate reductase
MARLIYTAISSVDGYVADQDGDFSWAAPDEEVHAFVNDLEREAGTFLLGRRMYEVLSAWETLDPEGQSVLEDYQAIWRSADKVVFSRSLGDVSTARTTLARELDPDAIRRLKESADRDLSIGGPTLAAEALAAGLVDEIALLVVPTAVGGGLRALPHGYRQRVELVEDRRFGNGTVFLRYRPVP